MSSAALWVAPLADLFLNDAPLISRNNSTHTQLGQHILIATATATTTRCERNPPCLAARTSLGRRRRINGNGDGIAGRRLDRVCGLLERLARHDPVDICQQRQHHTRWHTKAH